MRGSSPCGAPGRQMPGTLQTSAPTRSLPAASGSHTSSGAVTEPWKCQYLSAESGPAAAGAFSSEPSCEKSNRQPAFTFLADSRKALLPNFTSSFASTFSNPENPAPSLSAVRITGSSVSSGRNL